MQQNLLEAVPHLTTAMTGPLHYLEKLLLQERIQIETWLRQRWREMPPPPYCSVDLRNAGFKLAPVDTNLFPAGFNNLNPEFMPLCIQAAQSMIEANFPGCQRILLIPENHTRNQFYFESVALLQTIFSQAGFDIRIGSLLPNLNHAEEITLPSGNKLTLAPIVREADRIKIADFDPCIILLNHDLSDGIPSLLQGINQPITPPLTLGWSTRLKSQHFNHYQQVAMEFAQALSFDPWLINPYFTATEGINFLQREGEELIAGKVAEILAATQKKYLEYNIKEKPFVVIKADAGTYGMGIMMVQDAAEVFQLNRKERTRMATTKGNQSITRVLIQEGVYTFETWGEQKSVAEPVVYMLGQNVIGGFYRIHKQRGINENLNAPGMQFEPLAFVKSCNNPDNRLDCDNCTNRFYAYGVIARLALVAAARELREVNAHD